VRRFIVIVALLGAAATAAAQDNDATAAKRAKAAPASQHPTRPLPVVIPQQFAPPQEAYASLPESAAAAAPAKASACQLRLAKIAAFQPLPVLVGPGDCGATDAVQMDTIILPDQSRVAVTPAATLRCPLAEEIAHWIRDDIAPAVKQLGAPLRVLDNFDSYECRGRNRVRAAALSEHGRADALDVRAFKLADGQAIGLTDVNVAKDWREGIRATACARFSTVLGPGSDGFHEEHIHVDLADRRNGYKVCQWDVREPPPVQAQAEDAAPPAEKAPGQEETTAPIPIDEVPLPRPRPLAANGSGAAAKSRSN
jgi:hypothetical protein